MSSAPIGQASAAPPRRWRFRHVPGWVRHWDNTAVASVLAAAITAAFLAIMTFVPSPYVIASAGPTKDVLSSVQSVDLIKISGAETYPTEGQLDLVTVSILGGPGSKVTVGQAIAAWLDDERAARPAAEIYDPNESRDKIREEGQREMRTSQQAATAAALHELGMQLPLKVFIDKVEESSKAANILKEGDQIRSVGDDEVTDLESLRALLEKTSAGENVTLTIDRDGTTTSVVVPTINSQGKTALGILARLEYDFPIDVEIALDKVGGPSAGMIFALGIIDKLTPGAMTGGKHIAGTGTIDGRGNVGAIGGIDHKMRGAQRDGADWFLAPRSNCQEVTGHIPDGLNVVAVSTLSDARTAVQKIAAGASPDQLPACS